MKQLIGPCVIVGSLTSLCLTGIASLPAALLATFAVYLSGIVPENKYFPSLWFKSNIFTLVYRIYCSEVIGYKYLRTMMHARQHQPHSDYRHGVRCISGKYNNFSPFPNDFSTRSEFYLRGGGLVNLKKLGEDGFTGVTIVPIPILADNYAYFILSFATQRCAVIDPADPYLVLYMLNVIQHLTKVNFKLTDILTTHKHWDHAGGNMELLQQAKSKEDHQVNLLLDSELKIYGSETDKPHACTNFIKDGDILTVAEGGVTVSVLGSPGHTSGSVMFLIGETIKESETIQRLALFTGDCIFCAGCGAMFEASSVDEVLQTVNLFSNDKIRTHPVSKQVLSPHDILVYVGHEYTERLLSELIKIHLKDESSPVRNPGLLHYRQQIKNAMEVTNQLRSVHLKDNISSFIPIEDKNVKSWSLPACTVPSTLDIERRINPLLTLQNSVLDELKTKQFSSSKLQNEIYCSIERRVVD